MSASFTIKQDFRFNIFDSGKVVFYSDSTSFLLSNEIFVQIALSLDDDPKSIKDLTNQLAPNFSEKLIVQALSLMLEKGLLAEHYNSTFSQETQAFWYENGLNVKLLESVLKNKLIDVKAFCNNAHQVETKFTDRFEQLGFRVSEDGECSIFIVDHYLNPDLDAYVKKKLKSEHGWIPLKIVGCKIWLGPVFKHSGNYCWDCLKHSLKINRRVEVDLFGIESTNLSLPSRGYLSSNDDLAFSVCAVQLARWLVDGKTCPLSNQLVSIDPFNLTIENHQCGIVVCKKCSAAQIKKQDEQPYKFTKRPIVFIDENGPRSAHPENTIEVLDKVVSPITGIVPSYTLFQVNGDYVASSIRNLPICDNDLNDKNKSLRVPDVAVGKGKTKQQAKIGCFAESVERYNSTFFRHHHILAKYQELPHNGLRPEELLLFSETQYENRSQINKSFGSFNRISKKYDDSEIRWTQMLSLNGGDSVFVPSSYCFLNYPYQNEIELCPGDTNGCASGNTIEEAVVYAILELIERDAVAIWWYNKIQFPGIDIKSLSDPSLNDLIKVHVREDRTFHLIDITSDLKIPVFVAVSSDRNGDHIHFGTASHFNPVIAMTRAVRELNQIMTHTTLDSSFSSKNIHPGQREFAKWVTNENLRDHLHLNPRTKKDFSSVKYKIINSCDFLDYIHELNEILSQKSLSAYWLNLSQANIEFFTVKVMIPGLRHFWNRLGPGRLYDVPVELGMISTPNSEKQMNKTPYFL